MDHREHKFHGSKVEAVSEGNLRESTINPSTLRPQEWHLKTVPANRASRIRPVDGQGPSSWVGARNHVVHKSASHGNFTHGHVPMATLGEETWAAVNTGLPEKWKPKLGPFRKISGAKVVCEGDAFGHLDRHEGG
ncbi:PAS/PAC sensor hybrid histidine kinase [Anopheles sinensis]|uniref:PAS/PAC sensor hybrid histidine kinase n=1 Tax=Anopheles sinensis TaxID=74873 RepID=A0A084WKC2_ANOSI|nr:PAS/PAC sensor hybrid histidine kinase [Anopheles sinensis]